MNARLALAVLLLATRAVAEEPAAPAVDVGGGVPEAPAPTLEKPLATDREVRMTVVGRRRDDPRIVGSAQVVGEQELKAFAHDDATKVLKGVPGVYVRDEDGYGLRPNIGLRGANSDRSSKVTLLEDGVLFGPAPYAAPAAYYFPMMARITSVEVFKGPASVRSGPQTVGGAVNLVTREVPKQLAAGVDLTGGLYGTARAHGFVGFGNDDFGLLLEGVRLQTDGFKRLDGGGATGFAKDEGTLKLRAGFGTEVRHTFELKLGLADELSNETYVGLTDEDFRDDPLRRYASTARDAMRWLRSQVAVTHVLTVGKDFELRTVAYRHDFHRRWDRLDRFRGTTDLATVLADPTGGNAIWAGIVRGTVDSEGTDQQLVVAGNDRTFYSQGLQSTGTWNFTTGELSHGLRFGARLHADQIRRSHDATAYDMRGGALVATADPTWFTAKNTASAQALALHVLDEIDLGPFTFAPGFRLEAIRTEFVDELAGTSASALSVVPLPGLGLAWQPLKELSFLAGVHRGFSPLAPGQAAGTMPEDSVNVELGGRYKTRKVRAELIGFYNRYSNIVGNCTASSGCSDDQANAQFNGGAANVGGLEASAGLREKVQGFTLTADGAYTLTLGTFATSFTSGFSQFGVVREGDELPYVPMHTATLTLGLEHDFGRASVSGGFVSAMRDSAGQGTPRPGELTDAQFVLDASVSVRLVGGLYFTAKVTNLLDGAFVVSRRPYGARPNAPVSAMAGLRWELGGA